MNQKEAVAIQALHRHVALGVLADIVGDLVQAFTQLELDYTNGGEKVSPVSHELRGRLNEYLEVLK